MIVREAMRAGMDYFSAWHEPLSLVLDIIAARQIMEDGYRRVLKGKDAEDDFLRVMSAK